MLEIRDAKAAMAVLIGALLMVACNQRGTRNGREVPVPGL